MHVRCQYWSNIVTGGAGGERWEPGGTLCQRQPLPAPGFCQHCGCSGPAGILFYDIKYVLEITRLGALSVLKWSEWVVLIGSKETEHQNPPGKPQSKNWHIFGHRLNRPLLLPTKWPLWCNFQQYLEDPDQRHRPLWNLITFHIIRHSCTYVICIIFTYTDTDLCSEAWWPTSKAVPSHTRPNCPLATNPISVSAPRIQFSEPDTYLIDHLIWFLKPIQVGAENLPNQPIGLLCHKII